MGFGGVGPKDVPCFSCGLHRRQAGEEEEEEPGPLRPNSSPSEMTLSQNSRGGTPSHMYMS